MVAQGVVDELDSLIENLENAEVLVASDLAAASGDGGELIDDLTAVITSIREGKTLGSSLASAEFNKVLELLIVSANMIGASCPVNELVRGFDNNGRIVCGFRMPKFGGECGDYVDVEEEFKYSCSHDEQCTGVHIVRHYGVVGNPVKEYFSCSSNEICSRTVIELVPVECNLDICEENCS